VRVLIRDLIQVKRVTELKVGSRLRADKMADNLVKRKVARILIGLLRYSSTSLKRADFVLE